MKVGRFDKLLAFYAKKLLLGSLVSTCVYMAPLSAETSQDLFMAAIQGQPQRVQSILLQGLDVNSQLSSGRTALMAAAYSGNYRVVQLLLTYGANVNISDKQGSTALMDALVFGDGRIVKLLITAGADVNAEDTQGVRVLIKAKTTAHKQLVKLLEEAGAKERAEVVEAEPATEIAEGESTAAEEPKAE